MEINNVLTIFILNFWFENRPFSIFRAHFCAECRTTLACNRWIREKNTRISIFADFIVYIFHRLFFFSRTSNWILSSHRNNENSIVSIRRKNVWIWAWVDIFRTCRWQCNYVMSNWVWENTLSSNLKLSQFSIRFIYFTIWRNYCIGFSTPLAPYQQWDYSSRRCNHVNTKFMLCIRSFLANGSSLVRSTSFHFIKNKVIRLDCMVGARFIPQITKLTLSNN